MKHFLLRNKELLIITICSLFVTFLSTSKYIYQFFQKPNDYVFVGLPQYFEDYYYYLDQFYQGAHGGWLTYNNFTTENLKPTLIYFNNVFLGKIGGIIGLESYTSYNISLLLLKFIFLLLSYYFLTKVFPKNLFYRIYVFIVFAFSTSFPSVSATENAIQDTGPLLIFRAKNTFFSKFGNVPSLYLENIIFLILVMLSFRLQIIINNIATVSKTTKLSIKHLSRNDIVTIFLISILLIWLTISNAAMTVLFITFFILELYYFRSKSSKKIYLLISAIVLIFIALLVLFPSNYIQTSISQDPVYKEAMKWDMDQYLYQFQFLQIQTYFHAFGVFGLLFLLGTLYVFKNNTTPMDKLLFSFAVFSFILFFLPKFLPIPVPGFKFLQINTYLFASVISFYGIFFLEQIFKRNLKLNILFIYLFISCLTILPELLVETKPVKEPEFHFTYIPNSYYKGLMVLRDLKPNDAIVAASPYTASDLFIPGFTGKKTFTGHFLTNINSEYKDTQINNFFYKWSNADKVLEFLKKNNIKYIFHTTYSGNFFDGSFAQKYPFLKLIYENDTVRIYTY